MSPKVFIVAIWQNDSSGRSGRALPPIADIDGYSFDVRFVPIADATWPSTAHKRSATKLNSTTSDALEMGKATKTEIAIVLVLASVIIGFSALIAHHAAVNTLPDPTFRDLVRPSSTKPLFKTEYLYVPILFQIFPWLGLLASLLPKRFREGWLLMTRDWKRSHLLLILAWVGIISLGVSWQSATALRAATPDAATHSSIAAPTSVR